jgi:hypothetical protein
MSKSDEILLSYSVETDNLALEEGYTLINSAKDDTGKEVRVFYKGDINTGLSLDVIQSISENVQKIRKILEGKHTDKRSVDKILDEFKGESHGS